MAYKFSAVCSSGHTLYYNVTSFNEPYTVEVTGQMPVGYEYAYRPTGDLVIPETVTYNGVTYSVTKIGDYAFNTCTGLTSVIIPSTVTFIDISAFGDCIGLTSVTIPSSVTVIEDWAFYRCSNLTSITIPSSVTSVGSSVFGDTGWYNNQPDGILYLDGICLGYKGNRPTGSLTIDEGTRCIADYAFLSCNELTSATIPNSVVNIGFNAFCFCSGLTEPVYNANCFAYFPDGYATEYTIPDGIRQICGSAFMSCTGLTSVTIPNSVVRIDSQAFSGCSGLTSITIPNSVTSIGDGAFNGCNGITEPLYNANCFAYFPGGYATEYIIPDGIQQIAGRAFSYCNGLTSITIPSSVTSIGSSAFSGCSGLTEITIPNSVTSIGEDAFSGCRGLTSVTIGSSVAIVERYAFSWCSGLESIVSHNVYPPTIYGNSTFEYINSSVIVSVPCGSRPIYMADENWRTFNMVESAVRYSISVLSSNGNYGTAALIQEPTCSVMSGIISATPAEHYHFVSWNDGNTENPRTITVESDTTFTATFAIDRFTITVESDDIEMGTVSEGGTYDYGTEIQISATPRETYTFVAWNDGNTDNPRIVTVTSDATYIASFIHATGIDESIATEIAIFPNPATDILNITSSETISEIEIVNVMGQVVRRIEVNADNAVCDVEELKAGVYVVRIHAASATLSVRKFIKE